MKTPKIIYPRTFSLTWLIVVFSIFFVTGQPAYDVNSLGRWAHGYCYGITFKDNISYHGSGAYLVISDVSNPVDPVELDKISFPTVVRSVQILDDMLFVADEDEGLFIYDISMTDAPQLLGQAAIEDIHEVAKSDTLLFVAAERDFVILSIDDPMNPVELLRNDWGFKQIEAVYPIIYTVDNTNLLRIDVSDLVNPQIIHTYTDPMADVRAIHLLEDTLYLANRFGEFIALEIQEVGYREMSRLGFGSVGSDVTVDYPFAYFGATSNGVKVIDIRNAASAARLSSRSYDRNTNKLQAWNNYLFVTFTDGGMLQIDVSDSSSQEIVGRWPTGGQMIDMAVDDQTVYLSYGTQGMSVVDISDPQSPFERQFVETSEFMGGVVVRGDHLFVSGGSDGMYVYDISDPDTSVLVGNYEQSGTGFGIRVAVDGDYAYLTLSSSQGMHVLDISNLDSIVATGFYRPGEDFMDLVVKDDYVYLIDRNDNVHVVNVSDKTNPLGTTMQGDRRYSGLAIKDSLLFLSRSVQVEIYNITDPANIEAFGAFDISYSLTDIAIVGDLAYVIYPSGLRVLDITDPSAISIVGEYRGFKGADRLFADDDRIVVAQNLSGIHVLEAEMSTSTSVLKDQENLEFAIQPNPFSTFVQVQYSLVDNEQVSLRIYNSSGKLVTTLVDDRQGPGHYQVTWQPASQVGDSPTTGVYYGMLQLGNKQGTIKMFYLREGN